MGTQLQDQVNLQPQMEEDSNIDLFTSTVKQLTTLRQSAQANLKSFKADIVKECLDRAKAVQQNLVLFIDERKNIDVDKIARDALEHPEYRVIESKCFK